MLDKNSVSYTPKDKTNSKVDLSAGTHFSRKQVTARMRLEITVTTNLIQGALRFTCLTGFLFFPFPSLPPRVMNKGQTETRYWINTIVMIF